MAGKLHDRAARRVLNKQVTYRGRSRALTVEMRELDDGRQVLEYRLEGCKRRFRVELEDLFWRVLARGNLPRDFRRADVPTCTQAALFDLVA